MSQNYWKSAHRALAMLGIAALAQTGGQSGALAADLDPIMAPAYQESWEGGYFGLHVGYAGLKSSSKVSDGFPQSWSQKSGGALGGVLVGYNFDMDGFVLGFEADAGFGSINDTENRPVLGDVKVTHHGQHTFRLRAGLPVGPGMFYATGGLGLADMRLRSDIGSDNKFLLGFTAGGGYEAKITETDEYLMGADALEKGEVDGWVESAISKNLLKIRSMLDVIKDSEGNIISLSKDYAHMAVRLGDQRSINWINNWIKFRRAQGDLKYLLDIRWPGCLVR